MSGYKAKQAPLRAVVTYYSRHGWFRAFVVIDGVCLKFTARTRHPAQCLAAGVTLAERALSEAYPGRRSRDATVEHVNDPSWLEGLAGYNRTKEIAA